MNKNYRLLIPENLSGVILLFIVFCCVSCTKVNQQSVLPEVYNKPIVKTSISLNSGDAGNWTLYFGSQDKNAPQTPKELKNSEFKKIDATVPGNVKIDLENARLIEDPTIGDNVYDLRKYEPCQWWYQRNFKKPEITKGQRIELCFDGIDCIADIWLNNQKIAHVENIFVEHHFLLF